MSCRPKADLRGRSFLILARDVPPTRCRGNCGNLPAHIETRPVRRHSIDGLTMAPDHKSKRSGQRGPRGLGGAAGTAGLVYVLTSLASDLPGGLAWKHLILLVAPAASLAIVAGLHWAKTAYSRYLARRELGREANELQQILHLALESARSESHRQALSAKLAELQLLIVNTKLDRIRLLLEEEAPEGSPATTQAPSFDKTSSWPRDGRRGSATTSDGRRIQSRM